MKKFALIFVTLISFFNAFASENILGFWQTIDDETGKAKSIVCLYEKDKKLFGRIILLYSTQTGEIIDTIATQTRTAEKVKGKPKSCGLDIIWNMTKDGDEYSDGEIIDPANGKTYACEIWYDAKEKVLKVRGKILFIGRTQKWHRFAEKDLPKDLKVDPKTFEPKISK